MKQKDIALLVIIVIIAGTFSVFLSKFLFTSKQDRNLKAQVVQPIDPEFKKPDERVFNKDALNPTQLIQIGNNSNKQPF